MSVKERIPKLDWERVNLLIDLAILEDIEDFCDTTSESVIPEDCVATAKFVVRERCVCAGLDVAKAVFEKIDCSVEWAAVVEDGAVVEAGEMMASVSGNARSILTAERTALNFLQRLCGIATVAESYVLALGNDSGTQILDTRKTTPAWRNLEKYAVALGGGTNHRIGLYDRVMIKDNHRSLAGLEGEGGIARSVKRAKAKYPNLEVEVEVDTLQELDEALQTEAEYILLDNMSNDEMAEAVRINGGKAQLEASGGITIERIPSISSIGVDFISVGALTHSVRSLDISLEID